MAAPADNYILARDTSEAERLEIQHQYMLSCQGYYLHPNIDLPPNGARIADLCTGSAIFLRDIAPILPSAECHGFDISDKMFPARETLAENIELHLVDIRKPFDSRWLGHFDVVHLRFIEAAMRKEDWGPSLRNIITLLKPGGWLQWVEDDRAHSVRHAARPVAPPNAAKESLSTMTSTSHARFRPPTSTALSRFTRELLPNARSEDMTYGYMNLDALMKDSEFGNLENVGCDVFVIDREDDGGELRRGWAAMGITAVWGMLQARADAGEQPIEITRDEVAEAFQKDIDAGGHYITRASVFTGRKRT